ncbi:hypothetical protein GYMLUDRAFT_35893 [Collybiopsis luxurians FD-317 M1]|nr:hypothetical protein GYMLUDRAFT_35893 [Collybiopsis luxurians FD-317 M1]
MEFGGGDIVTALHLLQQTVEQRFEQLNNRLDQMELRHQYELENVKLRVMNSRREAADCVLDHRMRKTISGEGTALANTDCPTGVAQLLALQNAPLLGAVANYSIDIDKMSHQQIMKIMQFYNESMTIVHSDSIEVHRSKVKMWHTT